MFAGEWIGVAAGGVAILGGGHPGGVAPVTRYLIEAQYKSPKRRWMAKSSRPRSVSPS